MEDTERGTLDTRDIGQEYRGRKTHFQDMGHGGMKDTGIWDRPKDMNHGGQRGDCLRYGGQRWGHKDIEMQYLGDGTWETEDMGQSKGQGHGDTGTQTWNTRAWGHKGHKDTVCGEI